LVLAAVAFRAAPILIKYSSAKFTALFDLWDFDRPLPVLDFLKILYQTRFFRSTDPRDKLYGILGLTSSTEFEIKPHYEWSRQMVYGDLVQTLLDTTKKLQILSLSGISSVEKGHTCTLPSWVPHLDCESSAVGVPFYDYTASGLSIAEAHIAPNSLSLLAKGLVHSSVITMHLFLSESYPKDLDARISFLPNTSNYNQVAGAIDDIEVCLRLSRKSISWRYPTGDTVLLALFSLLTGKDPAERSSFHLIFGYLGALTVFVRRSRGRSFEHKLFKCGVTDLLHQDVSDAFWGSREPPNGFTDDLTIDANVVPFLEQINQAMSNSQCFFITGNKYIGIGPRAMRPDDKIFIPLGCDVPLVVRSTGKEFIIIGSCLIHGLMNGEIMKELERGNIVPEVLEFM
jgi:hypothetical protein